MPELKKSLITNFCAATLIPPMAWFLLTYYSGIVETFDEFIFLMLKPALWLYVVCYLLFILWLVLQSLKKITAHLKNPFENVEKAQAAIRKIPIIFIVGKTLYAIGGCVIVLSGVEFIDSREYFLGFIVGPPTIFLFSIPFFIKLNIDLEYHTQDVILPEENNFKYVSVSKKIIVSMILTILGGAVFLLVSMLAVLKNSEDAVFYDFVLRGTILITVLMAMSLLNLLLTSKHIVAAIKLALEHVNRISEYNFSTRTKVINRDETGYLLKAFNVTSEIIKSMVVNITNKSSSLNKHSSSIESVTTSLNQDAQEQASALEESAAAMEEISATVHQIFSQSKSQMDAVGSVLKGTEAMSSTMSDFVQKAEQINSESQNAISSAAKASNNSKLTIEGMANIEKSVNEIVSFVNVINDIADQTNLLSLNASIEAARAGEEGRGFAVVAQEISNLSGKATTATKEIQKLIEAARKYVASGSVMVKELNQDIQNMENVSNTTSVIGTEIAEAARNQSEQTYKFSKEIKGLKSISEEIVEATTEHKSTTGEVSKAIDSLSILSQNTAGHSQVIFDSTKVLTADAQDLQKMVSRFKVE